MPLIDCDVHFTDHRPDQWRGLDLPQQFMPHVRDMDGGGMRLVIGDRQLPRPLGAGCGNPRGLGHLVAVGDCADRRAIRERDGTRLMILQPGFVGLSIPAIEDDLARVRILHHYNDCVAREARASSSDTRWAMLFTLTDLEAARDNLREYRNDPLLAGIVCRPTEATEARSRWSSSKTRTFLAEAADAELTLFLHGGTGCYQWSPLADHFERYELTHALGHMGEHMVALVDLLCGGPPLPDSLRIVLLESGVTWIPPLLDRLESHAERLIGRGASVWTSFRKQFAVVPDISDEDVRHACGRIGPDNILYGSDYPHWDSVQAGNFFNALAPTVDRDTVARAEAQFVPRLSKVT